MTIVDAITMMIISNELIQKSEKESFVFASFGFIDNYFMFYYQDQ